MTTRIMYLFVTSEPQMAMYSRIIVYVLCSVLCAVSQGDGSQNYPVDCTLLHHLPCNIISEEGSCPPELSVPDGPYPTAASDFRISPSLTPPSSLAAPEVSWRMPGNSSFQHVKGFQLEFYEWFSNSSIRLVSCHVFNLTTAEFREEDVSHLIYNFTHPNPGQYEVFLTVLPNPGPGYRGSTLSQLLNVYRQDYGEESAFWAPELLTIEPDSCGQSVRVSFTAPDAAFDFRHFTVDLYATGHSGHIAHAEIEWTGEGEDTISEVFKQVPVGNYKSLDIWLVHEHHHDGKCKLYARGICDIRGGTDLMSCRCKARSTFKFQWTDENCSLPLYPTMQSTPPMPTSGPPTASTIVLSTILAIVFCTLVVGVVVWYMYRSHKRSLFVLIIYDGFDSKSPHVEAVDALAKVIENCCHQRKVEKYNIFQTRYPRKETYDVILFVTSEHIKLNLQSFQCKEANLPPVFDSAKDFAKQNIHCVRFEYTAYGLDIPRFSSEDRKFSTMDYCLPGETSQLLGWMVGGSEFRSVGDLPAMKAMKRAVQAMLTNCANAESGFYSADPEWQHIDDPRVRYENPFGRYDPHMRSVSEAGTLAETDMPEHWRRPNALDRQPSVRSTRTIRIIRT